MNKIVKWLFCLGLGLAAGAAWAVTVEKGVEITLEADAPEKDKAFHHWEGTGAPTGEAAFQPTWTYVPTASGEVTPVYGKLETVTDGGDFADAANFDYTLLPGSALVNAGSDSGTALSLPLDLNGNPRVSGRTSAASSRRSEECCCS